PNRTERTGSRPVSPRSTTSSRDCSNDGRSWRRGLEAAPGLPLPRRGAEAPVTPAAPASATDAFVAVRRGYRPPVIPRRSPSSSGIHERCGTIRSGDSRDAITRNRVLPVATIQQRRLLALVDYAQQAMRARTRVVSIVTDHGSFLLFDHQAQQIEGIRLDDAGPDGDDEIWLSVPHPPGPEVPPRADSPWLAPWLNVGAALISSGTHRDAGRHAANVAEAADPVVEPKSRVRLAEYPFAAEVRKQHARYLETVWRPWAEVEQRRRRLAQLYVKLFTLQQELSGALVEGQLELVWGMGLAISRQEGKTLAYPLLTRAVDLVFDPHTRAAEVRPREADPKLELEFFVATERPGAPLAEKA